MLKIRVTYSEVNPYLEGFPTVTSWDFSMSDGIIAEAHYRDLRAKYEKCGYSNISIGIVHLS
jgi:hypothetical protein